MTATGRRGGRVGAEEVVLGGNVGDAGKTADELLHLVVITMQNQNQKQKEERSQSAKRVQWEEKEGEKGKYIKRGEEMGIKKGRKGYT